LESSASPGSQPRLWQFILYRLFSLSGLVPIGAYLCVHLLTNMTAIAGPAMFQKNVNTIHSLGAFLPIVEWTFIFGPMIFHMLVGMLIISGAVVNVGSYPYGSNIRYTLQRATGVIAFFFIVWHILHLHHYGHAVGLGYFKPDNAASSAAVALSPITQKVTYIVGVTAATFHFANGLWTFGITWGIWTSKGAMKRAGYLCTAIGIGLFSFGMVALLAFDRIDVPAAQKIENNMKEATAAQNGTDIEGEPGTGKAAGTK
jgi:succinate dehydrogenase / fumarate reductase cytochrome b subunit